MYYSWDRVKENLESYQCLEPMVKA
jgi:hypothetical protein